MQIVKGYKAMNGDKTCRGYKFKVGTLNVIDTLEICKSGFHFCRNVLDVYNYYPKSSETIIAEIEASGKVIDEGDKSVTDKLTVIKFLSDKEVLDLWINKNNSGNRNSGDWNSGYGNSGNRNSGNRNSGDWNSGYGNSGDWNSGDWNSGDGNSGYFNTVVPLYFFNKPSNIEYTKELEQKIRSINTKPIVEYASEPMMTDEEKKNNPSYKVTGGFLRKTDRMDWRFLTKDDKEFIKSLPNFDNEVFKVISNGVSLLDDTIEVIVNGVTKIISKEKAKELGLL